MSKKINKDIFKVYSDYQTLLAEKKLISDRLITLKNRKPSRKDYYYEESKIQPLRTWHDVVVLIESKVNNSRSFKFQLRCQSMAKEPLFRFDSDGAAHKNGDPKIPLKEQMVTTPHFNKFDSHGKCIAYKTSPLVDEVTVAILLDDINLSFAHFCLEINIRFPIDEIPEINSTPVGQIPFKTDNIDFLSNVNFGI